MGSECRHLVCRTGCQFHLSTKNYISATVKGREWYHISRDRCLTKEQQFDWILHIEKKIWGNGYKFKKAFVKALKEWGLY